MAGIVEILSALGAIIKLITELLATIKKARAEGWISDLETVSAAIRDAKTDEERKALAKRLADIVRGS